MIDLTTDDRKLLTEKIRESPDEIQKVLIESGSIIIKRRTFLTWEDMGLVKERLVANGEWQAFKSYCHVVVPYEVDSVFDWIFDPSVFCKLAAMFWRERG